jgi:ferredoxin
VSEHVTVDPEVCELTGFCAHIAPSVFELGDEPPARVVAADFTVQDLVDAEIAANACPTRAIMVQRR